MGFRVKYKNKGELINGLIELKKIGALGERIGVSTYLPNNEDVDELINGDIDLYTEFEEDEDDICEFSIGLEERENIIKEYPEIIGKNNIMVSLSTYYDVEQGDVYDRVVPYKDMIKEVLKLIG